MRIAFYAPMKPPDHPVPSGDRTVARALLRALNKMGHDVDIVSNFVSRDGKGRPDIQRALIKQAHQEQMRLQALWDANPQLKPDLWLTYHHYYKAPDLITRALLLRYDFPLVIAEASHTSNERLKAKFMGTDFPYDWSLYNQEMVALVSLASGIIHLNHDDINAIQDVIPHTTKQCFIRPFLIHKSQASDVLRKRSLKRINAHFPALTLKMKRRPLLLSVGMMRDGAKMESWRHLARVMRRFTTNANSNKKPLLIIAGDGQYKALVQRLFQNKEQCIFVGKVDKNILQQLYLCADLFVWPAIDEAYGMAALEAHGSGLGVLAGRRKGLEAIVRHPLTAKLVQEKNHYAMAHMLRKMLQLPRTLKKMGQLSAMRTRRAHADAYGADKLHAFLEQIKQTQ